MPGYLKDRRTWYWFELLPDGKTVYFQFNNVSDDPAEPFERFVGRLAGFVDEQDGRTWIAPLLYTPPSFEAYRAKRDPALEAILASSGG